MADINVEITKNEIHVDVNVGGAASGSGAWGSISGTITDQTDLMTLLDAKLDDSQASAFGLSLLDDANASSARTTLGLGTLATQNGTFSGTSSGTNTGDQDLSSLVPYTGANANVDLGANLLKAGSIQLPAMSDVSFDLGGATPMAYGQYAENQMFISGTTDIPAILNVALIATTAKTFTFPNASGTFALTSDLAPYLKAEDDPIFLGWLQNPPSLSEFYDDVGYLTSESDPVYLASTWYSTTNNSANWNSAFGWGNHASAGYLGGSTGSVDNALLRADGVGGKTSQATGITVDDNNSIFLPASVVDQQIGFIFKGGTRFIHNWRGGSTTIENLFIGLGSGNFTMSSPGAVYLGGGNIAVGNASLTSLTTGYSNIVIGNSSFSSSTTGSDTVALGNNSFQYAVTASNNLGIGTRTGLYATAGFNFFMGNDAGKGVLASSTGTANIFVGFQSGILYTTASYNLIFGYQSGVLITSASHNVLLGSNVAANLTTGTYNIVIGKSSALSSATVSNELNIGDALYGSGLYGTIKIGIGITPTNITARLHLPAGSTAASSAPFKLVSGSLQTTAEVGTIEMLTDKLYFTITTGAARKEITLNDAALTSGKYPIITTNGRLTDGPTPLAGTKIYYVSDTSGGAVTRKLTFTNGILTSET